MHTHRIGNVVHVIEAWLVVALAIVLMIGAYALAIMMTVMVHTLFA